MKSTRLLFINVVSLLVLLGLFTQGYAQQDPQFTQYMYNPSNVNPAYGASVNHLSVFGIYRNQWGGIEGAPKTATLSATAPISSTGLGIGVHYTNDQIGVMTQNDFAIDLSYAIDLTYDVQLSFGVKASANLLDVEYSKLHIYNPADPISAQDIKGEFTPNIGMGMFLFTSRAYVGIAVPQLLQKYSFKDHTVQVLKEKMHFYLTAGYVFDVAEDFKLKPSALVKAVQGAPLQVDASLNAMFKQKFTLGVAYRFDASVSALAAFQVSKGVLIGYSYDAETTKIGQYTGGSHEFFLKFDLFNSTKRALAPRFF